MLTRRILATLALAACSPSTATIEGDVNLVTRGGDVRRGAANHVYLVPRDAPIVEAWAEMCEAQRERRRALNEKWDAGEGEDSGNTRFQARLP